MRRRGVGRFPPDVCDSVMPPFRIGFGLIRIVAAGLPGNDSPAERDGGTSRSLGFRIGFGGAVLADIDFVADVLVDPGGVLPV